MGGEEHYESLEGLEFEKRFPTKIPLNEEDYRGVMWYIERLGSKHKEEGYVSYTFEERKGKEGKKGEIICGRINDWTLELSVDLDKRIEKVINCIIKE